MDAERTRVLLADTLGCLTRYRASLLESRSGAASDKEQEVLVVQKLISDIERTLAT